MYKISIYILIIMKTFLMKYTQNCIVLYTKNVYNLIIY